MNEAFGIRTDILNLLRSANPFTGIGTSIKNVLYLLPISSFTPHHHDPRDPHLPLLALE